MEMDSNGALTNKERFKLLFKKRDESFIINAYTEYVKGYSVLDDKVKQMREPKPWEEDYKKTNRKGLIDFGKKTHLPKKYFRKHHPTSSVTIELLDDQISSYTLFRLRDKPIDISFFEVKIEQGFGIDPDFDIKGMNMKMETQQLLAMLHNGKSDSSTLNEVIEDNVKDLLKKVQIKDIANFVVDCSLYHKKYVITSPAHSNSDRRLKMRKLTLFN